MQPINNVLKILPFLYFSTVKNCPLLLCSAMFILPVTEAPARKLSRSTFIRCCNMLGVRRYSFISNWCAISDFTLKNTLMDNPDCFLSYSMTFQAVRL